MNKKYLLIVSVIILVLLGALFFIDGNKEKKLSDGERFAQEYEGIEEDNVFVYRNIDEIINIMERGTGVVYLGFPECPWCHAYVKYLNEVAKEVGIEKIYYYNVLEDRTNNTENYQKLTKILKGHLQYDEEGNEKIYVPNVSFHIEGKIIGNDYETSKDTHGFKEPSDYWTEDEVKELKNTLTKYMKDVYKALNECTECNI